jgi:hypothetical protein
MAAACAIATAASTVGFLVALLLVPPLPIVAQRLLLMLAPTEGLATEPLQAEEKPARSVVPAATFAPLARRSSLRMSWSRM